MGCTAMSVRRESSNMVVLLYSAASLHDQVVEFRGSASYTS
jgi:hypothetical protein